jgi:hypothetical protein
MTTFTTRKKNYFRWLLALVTATTLVVPYSAFAAAQSFGRSSSGMHGRPSSPHHFHGFGFFGSDGLDDQQVIIIQQAQPVPTVKSSEPPDNRVYVQPRWVDGGYGVQVLQPGYWSTPTQAAKH